MGSGLEIKDIHSRHEFCTKKVLNININMNTANQSINSFDMSLTNLWDKTLGFLPSLFASFIIVFLGYIIANLVGKAATKAAEFLRID